MKNTISPFGIKLIFPCLRDFFTIRFALLFAALLCTSAANAADLVWIGGTGNWNAAGNWSPAQIPTSADNAIITNSGIYTVTVPANSPATASTITVGGASGAQILAIDKTSLTITGASVINANGQLNFLVAGSTLTGAGDLTVNGTVNWANGTISGTGALTIGTGGTLAIGSGGVTFGRTLNNNGSGRWAGGNLTMSAGVTFNNLTSGRFDITADGRLMGGATTPVNNAGLFRQTGGTAGTVVSVPFNNSGTLDVLVATLNLNLGGNHTGIMSNALGATLSFGGGSHVLAGSSFVTGAGVLSLSGGATTLSASGNFDVTGSTLTINTGTATVTSSCNLTGTTLNIGGTGGVVLYNSAGSVGAVNLTAGTLGTLGGINPVTVTGPLTLGGGKITNALVTANGGITINGNVTLSGAKLVNPGTASWTAGNITGAKGAVISNLFGATFDNTFDGIIATGAGVTPVFVNAGLFQKTGGTAAAGATSIDFQFINTGTVEVQTNTLRYGFNQQTAGLTLLDGGGLSAQAQPIQILGGSLVGTNVITVPNTQNVLNSATISPGLPLGELDIAGNYQQTASGVLNIDLGGYSAGTNFDLVTVTAGGAGGVATLGGTLNITLTNGFSPTNGATFTFLTAVSRVGAFATFNYPSNEIGMQLSLAATSATIKVTNLKPVVANPIVDPAAITYGASFNFQFPANTFTDPDNDTLTYTASGMPSGVNFLGSTRTFSGTPTQAGGFPVTVVATDNGAPSLSVTNTFNITVTPATLAISAQPQAKLYGAADPALTYLIDGLQLNDTAAAVLTGALTRGAGETVAGSPYAITQGTLLANSNYMLAFTGNTLTISPATLTVAVQPQSKIYGAADPSLTYSVGGLQFSDSQATVLTGALGRAPGETVAGNPYAILQGALTANGNYNISFTGSTLVISKVALSITADSKTKTYGATNPAFTVNYSGFVNGETSTVLGGALSFTRAPGEGVGSYLLTPNGLSSPNYAITFNTGSLSITKAALSVTADSQTKVYGTIDPTLTATDSGFVNGDTASALGGTLSLSRAAGESVGNYLITPSGLTSSNYSITFNSANLSITKAALSVTATDQTKAYGASDPSFTVGYVGLVNGDTSAGLVGTLSFTRVPGENVGSYSITPSGLTSGNYTITFNPGTLTIGKAALSITADAKSKVYGNSDPAFTVTYVGLVNGDSAGALGGTLSFTRAPGENTGNYLVNPGGLTSANYNITFNAGTLNITAAPLSITADAKTKIYGASDPALTVTYAGFVNGDSAATLGGILTFARAPGESVAGYLITPSGLTSANYIISFNPGTLSITKATLSVTADAKTKIYGGVDPALTFTVGGLQFSDTAVAVLSGALTRASGESVAGSPYAITQGTLTPNDNYTINFTGNALVVTKAALSITADAKNKTYGAADPAFTAAYSGFVNGETSAVLGGALTFNRASGENVGSYLLTSSGQTSGNYAITFNAGFLTIIKAALSISADAKTKTYGATDPAFTATYAGFVKSESPAVLTGNLVFARTAGQNVGSYVITPGGQTSSNYTITFNTGAFTVIKAPLSVTADSKTKVFGSLDPLFTATYAGFVKGETQAVLGGTLILNRLAGESVGSYLITPSGLTSVNYSISFNTGTLTITSPAPALLPLSLAGTNVLISWSSTSNGIYRVQYIADFSTTNWTDLPGDVTATGSTASKTDAKTAINRFYRVLVLP